MLYKCGQCPAHACLSLTIPKATDPIAGYCLRPKVLLGPQAAVGLGSGSGQGCREAHFHGSNNDGQSNLATLPRVGQL